MNEDLLESLTKASEAFQEVMKYIENDQEEFWNSLSKDDQLKAFCAVVRRIHKGEVVDKGSYRYVLYQVFGFDAEAYAQAQDAGYLDIHNSIMAEDHDQRLLDAFCTKYGIEDAQKKIREFRL